MVEHKLFWDLVNSVLIRLPVSGLCIHEIRREGTMGECNVDKIGDIYD